MVHINDPLVLIEKSSSCSGGRSQRLFCVVNKVYRRGKMDLTQSDLSFMVDPLSYFSFQAVLHNWCTKYRGVCYSVCGMVHIKEPLLLIEKRSSWVVLYLYTLFGTVSNRSLNESHEPISPFVSRSYGVL